MKPTSKAILVAVLHVLLVSTVAGKLLYDRATRPRVWVLTQRYDPYLPIRGRYVQLRPIGNPQVTSAEPLAFFIPEHAPDPTALRPGEELWAEVTLPRKGPPRPIRLGVKKGAGPIVPLNLD